MLTKGRVAFVLLLWVLCFVNALVAQVATGTVVGTVSDSSGAVVANAEVILRKTATNETFRTITNTSGNYVIGPLPIGLYDGHASLTGFKTARKTAVQLDVGRTVRVDFSLEVGDVKETVSVVAAAPLLDTEKAEQGLVVDSRKLLELPLNARDFEALATLAPGVTPTRGFVHGGGMDAGGLQVHGNRRQDNVVLLDGSMISTMNGTVAFIPSLDALEEFQIKTGLYGAEHGVRPGGQIIAVTRSGTNVLHGSAFWFHRNDELDARNFFAPRRTEFKRNQFGGTLGGPVYIPGVINGRDKLWFFAAFEEETVRSLLPLTGIVPTADQKAGRFTGTIRDPLTGQPFSNNTIPAGRISQVSQKFLPFYPEPNSAGTLNFTSPDSTANFDNPQFISRVDYRATSNDRLSGRFLLASRPTLTTHPISTFSGTFPLRNWSGEITHTRTFATRVVNVAGGHFYRFSRSTSKTNPEHRGFAESLGIPELLTTEVGRSGVPGLNISGFIGMGDPLLLHIPTGHWQAKDDLSFQKGSHFIKTGFEYRRSYNFFLLSLRPSFTFSSQYTGNAFADFLLGYPSSSISGGELQRGNLGQHNLYFYIQDEWKISPKLSLSLGVRHENRRPWTDKRGFASSFIPYGDRFNPPLQNVTLQPWETGRFEAGEPLFEFDNPPLLPRFGFAYRASDKSVIRGGFGVYANEVDQSNVGGLMENPRPNAGLALFLGDPAQPNLAFPRPFPPVSQLDLGTPDLAGAESPFKVPLTHSWGLSVQRQLGRSSMIEVGYVGSRSTHLIESVSANDASPGPGPRQSRRPFPKYQRIDFNQADADSWYNGLDLRVEKRALGPGLYVLGSFTWSKAIDTAGSRRSGNIFEQGLRSRNVTLAAHKALSETHFPRRLAITAGYDLPFGAGRPFAQNGAAAKILGGWRIQGIAVFQDGAWFTVLLPRDVVDAGTRFSQWPDRIRDPNLDPSSRDPRRWFDTTAFECPQQSGSTSCAAGVTISRYGNAGRGTVDGPGIINLDFAVHRTFGITEQHRLDFRFEAFNLTNHPNFLPPGLDFGTGPFGIIGRALDSRNLQLGLKYHF